MEKILNNAEFKLKQILDRIKVSKNFEKRDDLRSKINVRDEIFLYETPKQGWEYVFVFDSKLKGYPIIYLSNEDFSEMSFLDYLGEDKMNNLHKRYNSYGDFEGTIEFIEKVLEVFEFVNSLPSMETIEDWFVDIEDLGYKIQEVEYGFLENAFKYQEKYRDYNCYNVPTGTESYISILISYNKNFELNDKFNHAFEDCKKASKIYLKENFKKLKGIYRTDTSYDISQIEIRFYWSF